MKYKFRIEDLDCPNCAAKVEKYLNNDSNLSNVSINFSKLTLTLETDLKKDVLIFAFIKLFTFFYFRFI